MTVYPGSFNHLYEYRIVFCIVRHHTKWNADYSVTNIGRYIAKGEKLIKGRFRFFTVLLALILSGFVFCTNLKPAILYEKSTA